MATRQLYHESARQFKATFEAFNFQYARDCFHAVEVASKTDDFELTAQLMEKALLRGIPVSVFSDKPGLTAFRQSSYWPDLLQRAAGLHESYKNSINLEIRKEINSMFAADQAIRERYYKRLLFRRGIEKEWQALNKKQVQRLIEITKEHGFPGEKLIGIDQRTYHEKVSISSLSAGMPIVMLIHHYSAPNPSFDSVLIKEIAKGNLYNEHFATICDFEAEYGKGKYSTMGPYGFKFTSPETTNEIDLKRAQIGMMSLQEYKLLNHKSGLTKFWNRLY